MQATDILDKAASHMRDRAATYDKPEGERSMAQTVAIFNQFHGTNLTEAQGWHFMQILKDVRLFANIQAPHRDSIEDGVAYSALKGEALLREDMRLEPRTNSISAEQFENAITEATPTEPFQRWLPGDVIRVTQAGSTVYGEKCGVVSIDYPGLKVYAFCPRARGYNTWNVNQVAWVFRPRNSQEAAPYVDPYA